MRINPRTIAPFGIFSRRLNFARVPHAADVFRARRSAAAVIPLACVRNFGIIAHIDAGKTTVAERALFYGGIIHETHEVKEGDGRGATMDYMDQERERGITINAATTHFVWKGHDLRLIDTPGHVDFNEEVERSLRVLDGAVLVLDAVEGVQTQTLKVCRQAREHNVALVAFVNKMDLAGADFERVILEMRKRLRLNAAALHLPVFNDGRFQGVVDVIEHKFLKFDGVHGEQVVELDVPQDMRAAVVEARKNLVAAVGEVDEAMLEHFVGETQPSAGDLKAAIRRATLSNQFVGVMAGAARANKGVQRVLDAINDYLPSPMERRETLAHSEGSDIKLSTNPKDPLVAFVFKRERMPKGGHRTFLRVFQGSITPDSWISEPRKRVRQRAGHLLRVHANKVESVDRAMPGDIVAITGLEVPLGTTLNDDRAVIQMSALALLDPVISVAINPTDTRERDRITGAMRELISEWPSMRFTVDDETGEIIFGGQGQLQLEVAVERLRREWNIKGLVVTPPRIAYRETPAGAAGFDTLYKKQTGGHGQFARIVGRIEPIELDFEAMKRGDKWRPFEFENQVAGGAISRDFIKAAEKGFEEACKVGPRTGSIITGMRVILTDGKMHDVDSSTHAFQKAAAKAVRETLLKTGVTILEPVMEVVIVSPQEFQTAIEAHLHRKHAEMLGADVNAETVTLRARVALAELLTFATDLRSASRGQAISEMTFHGYQPVSTQKAGELAAAYAKKRRQSDDEQD